MAHKDIQVSNEKNNIGSQYIVGGDLTITNTFNVQNIAAQSALRDINDPVEYHFPKLIDSFYGRDNELQLLNNWFFVENKKKIVISGLPGYGKSELTKQFVKICKDNDKVKNILWMDAETPEKLLQSFKDLARMLSLPEIDKESLIKMVYDYFQNSTTVFIFDNAKTRENILDFEPTNDCFWMVTSHIKDWGDDVKSLELTPLSPDAAVSVIKAVLNERFNTNDYSLYMTLADIVSFVPLALQIASAYVRQEMKDLGTTFNLQEYIIELKTAQDEFVSKSLPGFSANPYRISIYNAILKSLHKIRETNSEPSKLALKVLNICTYLYPDSIMLTDLTKIVYINKLLGKGRNREKNLKRAVSLLHNYSFINYEDGKITIHRLIQEILIFHQNNQNEEEFYLGCLEFILSTDIEHHRYHIISHADKKLNTFIQFYNQNKEKLLSTNIFLRHLVNTGCIDTLSKIFEDLSDSTPKVIDAFCLIHESAINRQHEILDLLLEHGGDVNKKDEDDITPIFEAAWKLDLHAVQVLANAGVDLNEQSRFGDSILLAIITVAGPPWMDSQQEVAIELIKWLVQNGARPNCMNRWLRNTLLHNAALALRPNIVKILIHEFDLNVNEQNALLRIPLHTISDASKKWFLENERRIETAKTLLELGSKTDVIDALQRTPAQHAREEGFEYLAEYIENWGKESEENQENKRKGTDEPRSSKPPISPKRPRLASQEDDR